MKTYNERLNEIAEEFVRVRYAECVCLDPVYLGKLIMMHKPLAAISLKHMAEEFKNGYNIASEKGEAAYLDTHLLQLKGLIPPQKP